MKINVSARQVKTPEKSILASTIPFGFFYGRIGTYEGVFVRVDNGSGLNSVFQLRGTETDFVQGQSWDDGAPVTNYCPIKTIDIEVTY